MSYSSRNGCRPARLRRFVEQGVDPALGVRIQHEDLPEVRSGVLEYLTPVFLWAGERLFVAVNDARAVILNSPRPMNPFRVRDSPLSGT